MSPAPAPFSNRFGSKGSAALVAMFLSFAAAYFLSAMLRAVTATLAPTFSRELSLTAADLGLLSGAYFFGFSLLQLPLGSALDRAGPKRVVLALLAVAAVACWWFASATSLVGLVLSRAAIGMGVSACLMAPLTAYRLWLPPDQQLRANAWMLMTGSFGMVASTLPVHALMPLLGWRGLFVVTGVAILASMVAIAIFVPQGNGSDGPTLRDPSLRTQADPVRELGYASIFKHPRFVQLAPVGFFIYGGMIAVQALWAGPWLTSVAGQNPAAAARGLFVINLAMLATFFSWGLVMPKLAARGLDAFNMMRWALTLPLVVLALNIALGSRATAAAWALWCVCCTVITPSQPRLAQEFPQQTVGRALSAYNLVVFAGVFAVQWGLGLAVDAFESLGWDKPRAFQGAFAVFGVLSLASYVWYGAMDRRIRVQHQHQQRHERASNVND